jgi:prepilin-type N-terminal cleavage/methylation domain-containing protein
MTSSFNYTRARGGMRSRRGFSLIETMVVLVIAGIVMSISLPKFAAMRTRMSVRSAKQQFSAYMATARASAIRQSQQAQFHIQSSHIWTTVNQPDGTNISVGKRTRMFEQFGVTLTLGGVSPDDSVTYDPRGMGATTTNAPIAYVFTKNGFQDSICVSRLGLIAPRCGQ